MPAIQINTSDKALSAKTFWEIMNSGVVNYLPGTIYVVSDKQLQSLVHQNLPIKILDHENVEKIVAKHQPKRTKSN
jgi:hypothetical protein